MQIFRKEKEQGKESLLRSKYMNICLLYIFPKWQDNKKRTQDGYHIQYLLCTVNQQQEAWDRRKYLPFLGFTPTALCTRSKAMIATMMLPSLGMLFSILVAICDKSKSQGMFCHDLNKLNFYCSLVHHTGESEWYYG